MPTPEPWLRGPLAGVAPVVMPVFFSFAQVREDLVRFVSGLSDEQVWQEVDGTSVGFHLKHIAGSVDRLTTYLLDGRLSGEQLAVLESERLADLSLLELMERLWAALDASQLRLLTLDPDTLFHRRSVGRYELPTTVIGLLVHLAEHTQRHLGQIITLAKIVRQLD